MKYNIFGLNVKIIVSESIDASAFTDTLSLYSRIEHDKNPDDIVVKIIEGDINVNGMNNPKSHESIADKAFLVKDNNWYDILYEYAESPLVITISIKNKGYIRNQLRKIRTYDFHYIHEDLPQIFHEMALIPSLYFLPKEKSIVHASGVKMGERTILIGGTGGVGKTSLEMSLCRDSGGEFITDDIAVVDNEGFVYPNYAYPKIYSYNVKNDENLRNEVLKNRSFINKFFWHFMSKIMGEDKVRRKVAPDQFYRKVLTGRSRLTDYYFLIRDPKNERVTEEKLDYKIASRLTRLVIENEYSCLNKHLIWGEMNSLAYLKQGKAKLNNQNKYNNFEEIYRIILEEINCKLIKIPKKINHQEMIQQIKNIIL